MSNTVPVFGPGGQAAGHLCDCLHLTYHPQGHARPSFGCHGCRVCRAGAPVGGYCHCDCVAAVARASSELERIFVWDPHAHDGRPCLGGGGWVAVWDFEPPVQGCNCGVGVGPGKEHGFGCSMLGAP